MPRPLPRQRRLLAPAAPRTCRSAASRFACLGSAPCARVGSLRWRSETCAEAGNAGQIELGAGNGVTPDLDELREKATAAAPATSGRPATQTVFGEGPGRAEVMLVGEQPGDREDVEGRPFVGPAGKVLDNALERAGIDRDQVYVTNVVKHFKWRPRGKRRIHQKPNLEEIMRLPAVARGRASGREAARARVPRRDCRAGAARAASSA